MMAAATMAIAAHAPAALAGDASGQHARLGARAVASHLEAPLVQLKSLDGHELRTDNDGRRIAYAFTAGAAALAAAVVVSLVRCRRARRLGLTLHADVRVRAPPPALPVLP